jgi:hypothetical protein
LHLRNLLYHRISNMRGPPGPLPNRRSPVICTGFYPFSSVLPGPLIARSCHRISNMRGPPGPLPNHQSPVICTGFYPFSSVLPGPLIARSCKVQHSSTLCTADMPNAHVNSKAIPLQPWTGPEGSRRLRIPDFKTVNT